MYHLPPNNSPGLRVICDTLRFSNEQRAPIVAPDLELQLRNINNQPEGQGIVYGWGSRTPR